MTPIENASSTLSTLAMRVIESIENDPLWPHFAALRRHARALVKSAHKFFDNPSLATSDEGLSDGWGLLEGLLAVQAKLDSHRLLMPVGQDSAERSRSSGMAPSSTGA